MMDLIYVAGTIAFFVLMGAYVAACARLGRAHPVEETHHEPR
jgi:hypothetical protein